MENFIKFVKYPDFVATSVISFLCYDDVRFSYLQSDSASCSVPELDLHLVHGTLGGKFTTVEGLLSAVRDQV